MKKQYITPDELLAAAFSLGMAVHESGFRPHVLVGIWRGGTPVAAAVHELLHVLGHRPVHGAIKTASYTGLGAREEAVTVEGLQWLLARLGPDQSILMVDDILDTGHTWRVLREQITGAGHPGIDLRMAVAWWKAGSDQTGLLPDYHVHRAKDWLVFPHEVAGLSVAELRAHKPALAPVLERLARHLAGDSPVPGRQ